MTSATPAGRTDVLRPPRGIPGATLAAVLLLALLIVLLQPFGPTRTPPLGDGTDSRSRPPDGTIGYAWATNDSGSRE